MSLFAPQVIDKNVVRLAVMAAIAMGLAIQVQPIMMLGGHLLRVSLSDLVLLPLLVLPLLVIAREPKKLPWKPILWAMALCLVLTGAYIFSVLTLGAPTFWATTKLVGGYVLLAYLVSGASIAVIGGDRAKTVFILNFVLITAAIVILYCVSKLLPGWSSDGLSVIRGRFLGLTGNPNMIGLILLLALCFAVTHSGLFDRKIKPGASWLIIGLLVIGQVLTISSAAWVATVACLFILLALRLITVRKLGIILALSVSIAFALISSGDSRGGQFQLGLTQAKFERVLDLMNVRRPPKNSKKPFSSSMKHPTYYQRSAEKYSVGPRLKTNLAALEMWRSAKFLGKGLGYFLAIQQTGKTFGETPMQIHNTFLWLLAETGLIGCIVFIGFLLSCTYCLWQRIKEVRYACSSSFASAVMVFIVGWQIMSLAHELLYQRVVFFALGMALAGGMNSMNSKSIGANSSRRNEPGYPYQERTANLRLWSKD